MSHTLAIMVCSNFSAEIEEVIKQEGLNNITVIPFESFCTHMRKDLKLLSGEDNFLKKGNYIHIIGGNACLSKHEKKFSSYGKSEIHRFEQCFHLLAPPYLVNSYLREKSYLISPGWLKNWKENLSKMGFNREMAREFFKEATDKLVFIDTGINPDGMEQMKELSSWLNIPFEIVPVGLDYVTLFLHNIYLKWQREEDKKAEKANLTEMKRKLADYVAMMDFATKLVMAVNEEEVAEKIFDLFTMLFAPSELIYIPVFEGRAGNIKTMPPHLIKDEKRIAGLLSFDKNYSFTENNTGFRIKITGDFHDKTHKGDTIAIMEIEGLAFPEYKNHYLNMAINSSAICSLAILNARAYEEILKTNRELQEEINERIRVENEKSIIEEQLRRAQKMKAIATLAGGFAHHFNNILGIILGYGELALYDITEGTFLHNNIQEIITACKRAKTLTKQIIAFSRQNDEGKKPLEIAKILEEAIKNLSSELPENIEIKENIKAKSSTIIGDGEQIKQAVINIAENAFYAMKENGGILEISLEKIHSDEKSMNFPGLQSGSYIKLTMSDRGCGMTGEMKERIFDPYFTTKPVGEGTGMGLSIVHGIIESHGGIITVESEPGKGTAFNIFFPSNH